MRKRSVYLLLSILVLYCQSLEGHNVKDVVFDFSGVDQFWKILELLEKDKEPSDDQWESLFACQGYKVLTASEFKVDFFKENFRLAFMPSKSLELEQALAKNTRQVRYLKHYIKVKKKKVALKKQQQIWQQGGICWPEIFKACKAYLPLNLIDQYKCPRICFVIFAFDARGYSSVAIDLSFAKELGPNLPDLLAHECHHYYRNQSLSFYYPNSEAADYDLLWVLDQLQAEAVADQIDIYQLLFADDAPFKDYPEARFMIKSMAKSPNIIHQMDRLLVEMLKSKGSYSDNCSKIRKLLSRRVHPTGYYMSNLIVEQLGKNVLSSEVGNPFAFFRLYNRAAKKQGKQAVLFSNEAMALLNQLEKKYARVQKPK